MEQRKPDEPQPRAREDRGERTGQAKRGEGGGEGGGGGGGGGRCSARVETDSDPDRLAAAPPPGQAGLSYF